jgi:acetoacetate decarboxylase
MVMASKRAEFYGAEMLAALWGTKPEIVERFLPPPLKPVERPIAMALVADYPKTNFGLSYKECGLFLAAQYKGIEGNYCLAMPVTDDLAMAGGREVFGYPKKMANIGFDNQGGAMEGFSERHGVKYFQIKAELTGEPNDPSMLELLGAPAAPGEERESFSYNFKQFTNSEGQGFD